MLPGKKISGNILGGNVLSGNIFHEKKRIWKMFGWK